MNPLYNYYTTIKFINVMKKIVLALIFVMFTFVVNAQGIYTKVTKYDKFDDIEWTKEIKTLITKTDTTFVIETKGSKPETYLYFDFLTVHDGCRDSLSNLVGNVWGYESLYSVLTEKNIEEARTAVIEQIKDSPDSLKTLSHIRTLFWSELLDRSKNSPVITVRTISKSRFGFEYDTDYIWINFKDGSRIIYSKDR